jgi:VWFA-related protein
MRAQRRKYRSVLVLLACSAAAQEPSVFRSGTRLVDVDVVVRDKHGPVKGLTKDDFALYDCRASERDTTHLTNSGLEGPFVPCKVKRQPLEMFREIDAAMSQGTPPPAPLRPGAVSNRIYSDGKPVTSATVVVVDQLDTPFDLKGIQRLEVTKFLQKIGDQNRIALYSLGSNLHILQDFTDDPKKLIQAVSKLDSGDRLKLDPMDGDPAEMAGIENQVSADMKRVTALEAIKKIIQHLEGVPGRKSLIWIAQGFDTVFNPDPTSGPPVARVLLGQANIAVYPVMVRSLQNPTFQTRYTSPRQPPPSVHINDLVIQARQRILGETLGGTAFNDAGDALEAVRTAEADARNYYVLGFYPDEKDLDGSTHQLTLDVSKKVASRPDLVLQYRRLYLASKPGSVKLPSLAEIFASPLNATAIGLAANIVTGSAKTGARQLQVTVSLADLQLRHENGHSIGSFNMVVRFERREGGLLTATSEPILQTVPINLAAGQVQEYGLVTQPIPEDLNPTAAHIVVQDATNGAAGSLRVPIPAIK